MVLYAIKHINNGITIIAPGFCLRLLYTQRNVHKLITIVSNNPEININLPVKTTNIRGRPAYTTEHDWKEVIKEEKGKEREMKEINKKS